MAHNSGYDKCGRKDRYNSSGDSRMWQRHVGKELMIEWRQLESRCKGVVWRCKEA